MSVLNTTDSFGEISLLDPKARTTARVCAVTDCLFLTFTKDVFDRFLIMVPEIVPDIKKMMDARLANDAKKNNLSGKKETGDSMKAEIQEKACS